MAAPEGADEQSAPVAPRGDRWSLRPRKKPGKATESLAALLSKGGLHVSAEELADTHSLVRFVDTRFRSTVAELTVQAEEVVERALAAQRRASLASVAALAQQWPGKGGGRRDGADLAAELREAAGEMARKMKRSASDSRLGRLVLASDGSLALKTPKSAEELFRSLDANLRTLERTFREGTTKHSAKPLPPRRRLPAPPREDGRVLSAPPGRPAFPEALPELTRALTAFQQRLERHLPKPVAVDPATLVSDFLRSRGRGSRDELGGGEGPSSPPPSPRHDAFVPWQILAPLPRLPWELPQGDTTLFAAEEEQKEAHAWQRGLRSLLRRRRRGEEAAMRSLRDPGRRIAIVTTASLPWMTGTSVNPLLRAAYLARDGTRAVTLLLPWLAPADQKFVHPGRTFGSPEEQTEYVKAWVAERVGFAPDIKFTFYPGRWAPDKCSILPVGDITAYVPDGEADVAVLEEPEHLTWYHHGVRWSDKFAHVVGVVHTNYLEYARREEHGGVKEAVLRFVNSWVCRAYCHKVVKLSDAVQALPRSSTCFIHGVSPRFLDIGAERARRAAAAVAAAPACDAGLDSAQAEAVAPAQGAGKGVYFIGKVVWGKGYTELLNLVAAHCAARPDLPLAVDVYGGGDDLPAVSAAAAARALPLAFKGPRDHADASLHPYSVFVNPSLSDVVATTTAEALAMGKWVIVAEHPSNSFFTGRFANCLTFRTPAEFSAHLATALAADPAPLTPAERAALSWEAATERFMDVADSDPPHCRSSSLVEGLGDWAAAQVHQTLTGVEQLRGLAGAGPNTKHAPADLSTWRPQRWTGGPMDRKDRAT